MALDRKFINGLLADAHNLHVSPEDPITPDEAGQRDLTSQLNLAMLLRELGGSTRFTPQDANEVVQELFQQL